MFRKSLLSASAGVALLAAAVLSGCTGSTDSAASGADQSGQSGTVEDQSQSGEHSSVIDEQPEVDRDYSGPLPKITLPTKDEAPEISPVTDAPPDQVTMEILEKGKEKQVVGPDDYIEVNYAGWLWDGEKFDSSFTTNGQPTPLSFSLNQVISGWKWGLSGTHVGDQVLLVVPPQYGYGDTDTGMIPSGSTLVFYVEILDAVSVNTQILEEAKATEAALPEGLTIEGEPGQAPEVVFDKSVQMPEEEQRVLVAEGTGSVVSDEDAVEYLITVGYWGSQERSATWEDGVGLVEPGSILTGEKVGSRILLVTQPESEGSPATFVLVDILAAHPMR